MLTDWLPLLGSALVSILGGGLLGAWMTHNRLAPKSKAEARDITAAAMDKDWSRFQREIGRLVKRLEDAEAKAERADHRARECEERESLVLREAADLRAELARLRAIELGVGQGRQAVAAEAASARLGARK